MYMMDKPLCIVCDDADVLEKMLRNYNGRALYEGTLDDEVLKVFSKRYGLIY